MYRASLYKYLGFYGIWKEGFKGRKCLVCMQKGVFEWHCLSLEVMSLTGGRVMSHTGGRGTGQKHSRLGSILSKESELSLGVVGEGWEIWSYMIKYAFKKVTLNCVKDELERRQTGHRRSYSKEWLLSKWEMIGQADAIKVRIESQGSTSWTVKWYSWQGLVVSD